MQNNDILNELSTNFIEYAVAVNTELVEYYGEHMKKGIHSLSLM